MASIGRRLFAAGACLVALYACTGKRKVVDAPDRGNDAGSAGDTSTEGGSGGAAGSSSGGASGNQGGTDPSGGSPGGEGSSGEGGVGGTSGVGGMSAMGGADGLGGLAGGGAGTSGESGAGRGGIAGANGAGASGAGAGGFGADGVCTNVPSIAELFPAVVPTDQSSGLDGDPSPEGAPARSFDGYLLQVPCTDTNCDDCTSAGWAYEGIATPCTTNTATVQNFWVGGIPGVRYRVTLHFYGIVGPRNYGTTATRATGSTRPMNLDTGATPPPWAYAEGSPTFISMSDYESFEIHVVDHQGQDVCSYYVNSDTAEGHWTYVLDYEKTIDVIGAGRIRVRYFDRNCRLLKNCTPVPFECNFTSCENRGRLVDTSAADPQPVGLEQPGLGNDTANSGQWLFVDVTNVTCGPAALGCSGM